MTLSQAKDLLTTNSIPFQECEFASEADFLYHISPSLYIKNAKEHKYYALIVQSNNGKKHIELEFEEKNGEFVFWDLWFGDFCFEYFAGDASEDVSYLLEEIQEIMQGKHTVIMVTNPKTKRWIADAQFDRSDPEDDWFGEIGFQRMMKRIRKKRTIWGRLFGSKRSYEIYDWNTYQCIVK